MKRRPGSQSESPSKKPRLWVSDTEDLSPVDLVRSNSVILTLVFSFLSPGDVKSVALVCRDWSRLVELPRFWTWARLTLSRENIEERAASVRLRNIPRVVIERGVSGSQLDWLFLTQETVSLRSLNFRGADLSGVSGKLVSEVVLRLEQVEFHDTDLSSDQVEAIFTEILERRPLTLRTLKLSLADLSSVPPAVLATALVKLEEVRLLSSNQLSREQIVFLFNEMLTSTELRLRKLKLHYIDLSPIAPEDLSAALLRLENVHLSATKLTKPQVQALLLHTAQTPELKLRSLRLFSKEASNPSLLRLSPSDLAQALVRLEKVDLTNFILIPEQGKAVFKAIVSSPSLKLRRLTLVAGLYLLFARRCEDYISEALARLETVNILGFSFKPKVANAICQKIVNSKTMKLRALKLWRPEDFPVSSDLLKEMKEKVKVNFVMSQGNHSST